LLRSLYNRTLRLAESRHALWALMAISFAESSCFPIPPDVLLAPMVVANRQKAWLYAATCTIFSVLGAFLGYAIGYFFFEVVGQPLLAFYGYEDKFATFQQVFNAWGWWIVIMAGFTPFPYKVITITSGLMGLNLPMFALASFLSRGMRFFLVAGLLWKYGAPIKEFIDRNLGWITAIAFFIFLGGFYAVKFVF